MSNLLLPEQIQKDIPGFEGLFFATTDGKIYSYSYGPTNTYLGGAGYIYTRLKAPNHTYRCLVHRLIALTFVANPLNKPCVNHEDGNKQNNNYWNLKWVTHKENTAHAIAHGLISTGENHYLSKLTEDQAIEIIESSLPTGQLAKKYGVTRSRITSIKNGYSWKHLKGKAIAVRRIKLAKSSKLTREDVLAIYKSSDKLRILSAKYKLSESAISQIRSGKTFTSITSLLNK